MISKEQLKNLVLSDDKIRELATLSSEEIAEQFDPVFSAMKGYSQNNPHHHLTLLDHTLAVALGIKRCLITEEEFIDLRIAALFHDIAKPLVKKEKNGRSVYYGHAEASAKLAENLLLKSGFTPNEALRILFFIQFHDAFIPFKFLSELDDHHSPHLLEINTSNVTKAIDSIFSESKKSLDYTPSSRDLALLASRFCPADQDAQAEIAVYQGIIIDSRENKKKRIKRIYQLMCNELNGTT